MLMLSMLMGCRSIALGFVLVAPDELVVEQAYARVQRYRLRDCDGDETREWVGQRLNLRASTPDVIRDREWCGVDIQFKDAPLFGPPLGWRGETAHGTGFDISLAPGTVSVDARFGGSGDDQVILLDLGAVMSATELDSAALETKPPLEDIEHLEDSAWSQERLSALPGALSVSPLRLARARSDWPAGAFAQPVEEGGCGSARQDTGVWWGDTGYTAYEDTGTVYPIDTGAPEEPSSGGCGSDDTGSGDGADDTGSDSSEDDSDDDSNGCQGGSDDSGGSGGDTGWSGLERRVGLAVLVGAFWLRRRGGRAAPARR